MKKHEFLKTFILLVLFLFNGCFSQENFLDLNGPYLGQKPPGTEPEIFAPGLITTHYSQSYIAFLYEARVCVYSASTEKGHETYYTYEKDGHWITPQRAPFEELQGHPNYTTGPLGRKVYFHSGRPTHPDDTRQDDNIWTIEWTGSDWAGRRRCQHRLTRIMAKPIHRRQQMARSISSHGTERTRGGMIYG